MKRIIAILLTGVMLFSNIGSAFSDNMIVHAKEIETPETITSSDYWINPIYEDVITKEDLYDSSNEYGVAAASDAEIDYVTDEDVIINTLCNAMTERTSVITINYEHIYTDMDSETIKTSVLEDMVKWYSLAIKDTSETEPYQGDYLKFHLAGYEFSHSGLCWTSGLYQGTLTFNITYHSSKEQEQAVTDKVNEIIYDTIDDSMSEIEKVKAIYDYICQNVSYDHTNLKDDDYTLKYSAYAALINKTAVCQGYASALYRLLKEAGISTRVISGTSSNEPHAWNIIKVGDLYYYADATWDTNFASTENYQYFLKCAENFANHDSDAEYITEEFYAAYPISSEDYDDLGNNDNNENDNTQTEEDTISEDGLSGKSGNASWILDEETGILTVSGTGPMKDYTTSGYPWYGKHNLIKEIIVEEGITHIGDYAFSYSTNAVKVQLPETVTSIGNCAFQANYKLHELTMPSVKSIGEYAFANCNELSKFEWPKKLETIGAYAFYHCEALDNVDLADCLTSIDKNAFEQCWSISEVILPESLKEIGNYAFDSCKSIKRVFLPDSLTELSDFIFRGCSSLTQVELPENLITINSYAFADCVNLVWVWIPEGVEVIEASAFEMCARIERILIPASVNTIGFGAFFHCLNLKDVCYFGHDHQWDDITICGQNAPLLEADFESDANVYTSFQIKKDAGCVENGVIVYTTDSGTTRTESLQALGHSFVEGIADTQWICETCNETVTTEIGTLGYGSCGPNLTWHLSGEGTITIKGTGPMINVGVRTSAPWYDLQDNISKVVIADGVTYLGEQAFFYCDKITEVILPDSMTAIGAEAFYPCVELKNIKLPDKLVDIGDKAFFNCRNLPEILLPDTVTTIGEYAFYDCKSLKKIILPESLTTIGQYAFAYCDGIEQITLPDNLKILGDYAFDTCKNLKEVSLPDKLEKLGVFAFRGCGLLEKINIPKNIMEIGRNTFDGCICLRSIIVPQNIRSIEYSAFYNCSELQDVYIYSYNCTIANFSFANCSSDLKIHGIKGSIVETYANTNNMPFVVLNAECGEEHVWSENYTIDSEPTCTTNGLKSIHCYICDKQKAESVITLPKLEHQYTVYDVVKEATCTAEGSEQAYCDYGCGTTDVRVIGATGHSYGSYKTTTKATFGKSGVQTATCTKCSSEKKKSIEAVKTPTLSTTTYTFNNKVKTPSVTVKNSSGTALNKVTSTSKNGYMVKYASGRKSVGKYSVKVTLTGANYTGTKTLYFKINPKGVAISSLSRGTKAFTVKWKKPTSTYRKQMTGYQIRYSTFSKMTSAKKVTIKSTTATSKKISKLKAKKYYYVQLRTYKKIGSTYYYSGWSSVKKVKTK